MTSLRREPVINFGQLQQQGQARPPKPPQDWGAMQANAAKQPPNPHANVPLMTTSYAPGSNRPNRWYGEQAGMPRPTDGSFGGGIPGPQPGNAGPMPGGYQPTTMTAGNVQRPSAPPPMPNVEGMWTGMHGGVSQPTFGGGPQSNFDPGAYKGGGSRVTAPGQIGRAPTVQAQGQFSNPNAGGPVNSTTMQRVLEALQNPSRYDSKAASDTFDVLDRRLTQGGAADKQRIDEDMASRGLHASTTAGGRLGDLATNLNQQRADYATQITTDQAKNYQADRSSAVAQALGWGGQEFDQAISGFGANQAAGAQRFGQESEAAQLAEMFGGNAFDRNVRASAHNEGLTDTGFRNNLSRDQFRLGQNNQNFGQRYDTFGANQGANQLAFTQRLASLTGLQNFGQQGFENQLTTAGFNADQDYRNTQLLLQQLGML